MENKRALLNLSNDNENEKTENALCPIWTLDLVEVPEGVRMVAETVELWGQQIRCHFN